MTTQCMPTEATNEVGRIGYDARDGFSPTLFHRTRILINIG
jgi:hypothetical protein